MIAKNRYNKMFLGYFVVCFFLACKSPSSPKKGLKDVADFKVGTAIRIKTLLSDAKLQEFQILDFNSITSASDMKMNRILNKEGEYYWERIDSIIAFAENNNQRIFGHNLIWHSSTPKWVEEKGQIDSLWMGEFMREYIHTYVGRYKGKISGWDVVNEGLETNGVVLRETMWYKALGEEYIANAFRYAHEADPEAILFYNDFNIERDTVKLNATLDLIENLRAKGVPISGLGFQMHIRMDIPDDIIEYSLKKGAETGLQIHLSEVDIIFNKHDDTRNGGVESYHQLTEDMKNEQGEKYRKLVGIYRNVVPKEQQFGITFWDFTDRDSWIRGFFNMNDWPCLYDDDLQPKPAYYGVWEGLSNTDKD